MDDDPVWGALRVFPFLLAAAGVALVAWMARTRLPGELEEDVLRALSETEALSMDEVCRRAPLTGMGADPGAVRLVLERLCRAGRVVRWYEQARPVDESESRQRQPVYRRVAR